MALDTTRPLLERIGQYLFPATAAEFESDFPTEESVTRLRAATRRRVLPWVAREFVAGPVSRTGVRLQRVQPLFSNSFRPIFAGRFSRRPNGRVVLEGTFRMSVPVRAFTALTLAFVVIWIMFAVALAIRFPDDGGLRRWLFPLAGVAFLFIEVQGLRLACRLSKGDVDVLSAVITRALTGRVSRARAPR